MRGELDERSDIFALGLTFFHIFAGRPAFLSQHADELRQLVVNTDAPRLSSLVPGLSVGLSVIIGRMLAREPTERYQHVGVILEDLRSYEARGLLPSEPMPNLAPPGPMESSEPTEFYHAGSPRRTLRAFEEDDWNI